MKRTPLLRRTPMRRTTNTLRRTPLNPVSRHRAKLNRQRKIVVDHVRAVQDWCSRCGKTGVGLDAHELKSRAQGGSIVDLENIVLLCRPCHSEITVNPKDAAEQGWAISRKYPKDAA